MRAISLWQPWATLIVLGAKRYETRWWPTKIRGTVAVHAAKKWTEELAAIALGGSFRQALRPVAGGPMHFGAIIGTVDIVDCFRISKDAPERSVREEEFGDWGDGRCAWLLANPRLFSKPIPCRGRQGFFEVEIPEGHR